MKKHSIWLDYKEDIKNIKLDRDLAVDVLIIGGGITGLSTAYHLINKNLNICLVDRNKIAHGVTSRTTGKLTYLQQLIYSKLITFHSDKTAKIYLESQRYAIKMVEDIIVSNNIDCDFEKVNSYLFTDSDKDISKIKKEKDFLIRQGIEVAEFEQLPIDIDCVYGISVAGTAVFHPLKYLYALKKLCLNNKISIYENTAITKIEKENDEYNCYFDEGVIRTKKIVLATHYPYFTIPFLFPLKTTLEKSYISAYKASQPITFSAITSTNPVKSIRPHNTNNENYIIYLTNSHNIAMQVNEKNNFEILLNDLSTKPNYIWSNIDVMTNDYLPYIGCIDKQEPNFLIGTGYNTWGMTNGSLAGKILSDIILNKDNEYISLFNPLRSGQFVSTLNFPVSISSNIKAMIQNKISVNKKWYPKELCFKKIDGREIAIYRDKKGKLHTVFTKCPHLGCHLIFNQVELTWDCPCHGSRFDIDGNCLDGPSKYNIAYSQSDDNEKKETDTKSIT